MSNPPMAFLSYVRADDLLDDEFITAFRERLTREVHARGVTDFSIFQDRFDIEWGQDWAQEIDTALAKVTFLIPILTPRFFQSAGCRYEVNAFVRREEQQGRHDLILPVYYRKASQIDDPDEQERDPVAKAIARHQFMDWRELRNTKITTKLAKDKVDDLADRIVGRLKIDQHGGGHPRGERVRVLNPPPDLVPAAFHDRVDVLHELLALLDRPDARAVVLAGDDGMGKTAIAAEVLPRLRERPDPRVDVFDYLSARGFRPVNAATIIQDLALAHPVEAVRSRLGERLQSDRNSWLVKLDQVLGELTGTRVLIVIDDAEDLLDAATGAIRDSALRDLVQDLCKREDPMVRLLLVTSRAPEPLFRGHSADESLALSEGLPSSEIIPFLAGLDGGRVLGLASATGLQDRLFDLTRGRPRTLELVYATLAGDPGGTLASLLEAMRGVSAKDASKVLLERLEGQLSSAELLVLQAVAVFGRPVRAEAIKQLLSSHLPNRDVSELVGGLARRRLVRRDGDRFYLPPSEAAHVRGQIRRGRAADRTGTSPPWTLIALLHGAADYFRAEAERAVVSRIENLGPHFSEIDLRVQGGEYERALEAMDGLDDEYLERWGHSDALTRWRQAINPKLDREDKIPNLERMAAAKRQQDELGAQIGLLQRALRLNGPADEGDAEYDLGLRLNLAGAYFDNWRLSKARAGYVECLTLARELAKPLDEAMAHQGLGFCLVETGSFSEAARHYDEGLAIAEGAPHEDQLPATIAELWLNRGVLEFYRGRTIEAIESLKKSRSLAEDLGDVLLSAQAMDAQALAELHFGAIDRAIELAEQAANIGVRSGVAEVSHAAAETLTRIQLQTGEIEGALVTARAGARIRPGRKAAGLLAVRGIAELRLRRPEAAHRCFLGAHHQAREVLKWEKGVYQVLETNGLVLTGLVLCGQTEHLQKAEKAYHSARRITREPGAVWLCVQLFEALAKGADPKLLKGVRDAAMGTRSSPSSPD
ncbi:TIR domain-containing protein [Actinomadura sp. 9N215]|uniref:TIR domain-containing protein n=1 Tax=Actinomadura sp. 9N215 TaxID=3375150 RepID=UPI00378EA8C9